MKTIRALWVVLSSLVAPTFAAAPIIAYTPDSLTATVDIAIAKISPIWVVGPVSTYSISPDLQAATALKFNTITGDISGTPKLSIPRTAFTIIATGPGGVDTTQIFVRVDLRPATVPTNVKVTALVSGMNVNFAAPTYNGGSPITGYRLLLNPGGIVFERPYWPFRITGLHQDGNYSFQMWAVTAYGAGDTVTGALYLQFAYSPIVATVGVPISKLSPAITAGTPVKEYKVVASDFTANTGLSIQETTGDIRGTPNKASPTTLYAVAARSVDGTDHDTAWLSVTVNAAPVGIVPAALLLRVNGFTKPFEFHIPETSLKNVDQVRLSILDASGRTVWSKAIVPTTGGAMEISWNGKSENGRAASAGVYIARVSAVSGGAATHLTQKSVTLGPR